MKTINLKQAKALGWCWFASEKRKKQLERYAAEKPEWTALDILRLPAGEVSNSDKLYVVLHPSLIDEPILHSLACDFAERAAAWAAARDARDAARDAERAWQVSHVIEVLEAEYEAD